MRPRLEACYSVAPRAAYWPRFATVLEYSARQHCPQWDVHVHQIDPPTLQLRLSDGHIANAHKLKAWALLVAGLPDGTPVLLLDVDTVILRPLDDIWDQPFDIAYTVRPTSYPINGGVLFVRISTQVRRFFLAWLAEQAKQCSDKARHQRYQRLWRGYNQAAWGALREEGHMDRLTMLPLPCQEWNCEDTTWARFDPHVTRILHVKDHVKNAILSPRAIHHPLHRAMAQRWLAVEAQIQEAHAGAR